MKSSPNMLIFCEQKTAPGISQRSGFSLSQEHQVTKGFQEVVSIAPQLRNKQADRGHPSFQSSEGSRANTQAPWWCQACVFVSLWNLIEYFFRWNLLNMCYFFCLSDFDLLVRTINPWTSDFPKEVIFEFLIEFFFLAKHYICTFLLKTFSSDFSIQRVFFFPPTHMLVIGPSLIKH